MLTGRTGQGAWLPLLTPSILLAPLWQHRGRTIVAITAIAIGVALGLAVQIVNTAAVAELSAAARQVSGRADLIVQGPRGGFDERLYPRLARHPDVLGASPAVEVEATVTQGPVRLRVIGLDVFQAAGMQPALMPVDADPMDLLRSDRIFLSRSALAALGTGVGEDLPLRAATEVRTFRVAGVIAADPGGLPLGVMDIGAAQWHFGRTGLITRIDLRLRPGRDPGSVAASLPLPAGVIAEVPEAEGGVLQRMTRAYRVNLNVLALVALFTGGLLVSGTQALAIARRRAQLALWRVIGYTRRQVALAVLAEGAVVGGLGAVIGVAAGVALAWVTLQVMGGDLGAGYFSGSRPSFAVAPGAAVLFGALGVATAVLGSVGAAREAVATPPAQALKSGDDARAFARLRSPRTGVGMLVCSGACAWLPPVGGLPLFGYLAIACMLAGTILILPRLVSLLLAPWPTPRAVPASLGLSRLRAYPTQAAVSLAAIVAAVSLTVAMAVMVASFRSSLDGWLGRVLPADLYLRSGSGADAAFLSAEQQVGIARTPGIGRVEFLRTDLIRLDAVAPRVTILARDGVDDDPERRLPIVGRVDRVGQGIEVWVSESAAAIHGWRPGDAVAIPLAGHTVNVHVAGVWRDYARQGGAMLLDRRHYVRLTGDSRANDAGIWVQAGHDRQAVREALRRLAPDTVEVVTPQEVREISLGIFDRTFAVTYALEVVAVLIALMGLSSAIGAEVLARRREFGMLRHLGVTRREIVVVLASEGAAVTLAGLVVGAILGSLMSLVLIHVVNRQSFHWGMDIHVPWTGLGVFFAGMFAAALITAMASGRHAMSGELVRAVREDW